VVVIKLPRIRVSGKTRKKFRQHEFTKVERMVIAPETEEQAHDRQAREGRLENVEKVPLSKQKWYRRFMEGVRNATTDREG
jgi:hypothetical protein